MVQTVASRLSLPSLPRGVRLLSDEESKRLSSSGDAQKWPRPSACQTCRGTGEFLWYDAAGDEAVFDCNCEDQWMLHRFLLNAGIPIKYQQLGWADFKGHDDDRRFIEEWLTHADYNIRAGRGLFLQGGKGSGKTLLATLLMRKLMVEHTHHCFFTEFYAMVDMLSDTWGNNQDARRDWNVRVRNTVVLVIDGLGNERTYRKFDKDKEVWTTYASNPAVPFALESILRHRQNNGLTTIITTDMKMADIIERYGEKTWSVIEETMDLWRCQTGDYRGAERDLFEYHRDRGMFHPVVVE
jgi:DNA replication protein DnaC